MYLLIEVAGYIDVWPTIALVMLTAVIGVALLKRQGLATLTRGMGRLEQGQVPAQEMAEGLLLAVAGALLITPGFVTDAVGFTLLFPPTRKLIALQLMSKVDVQSTQSGFHAHYQQQNPQQQPHHQGEAPSRVTLEGDFERRE